MGWIPTQSLNRKGAIDMGRPRDARRQRTYDLIDDLTHQLFQRDLIPDLSPAEIDHKATLIQRQKWFKQQLAGPGEPFRFNANLATTLLDLAFTVARRALPDDAPWTGREFSSNYIKAIDKLLGKEAGRVARALYVERGLSYRVPRRMSDEAKAAAAERLINVKAEKVKEELLAALRGSE